VTSSVIPPQLREGLSGLLDALSLAQVEVAVFFHSSGGTTSKLYANDEAIQRLGYTVEEWFAKPMFEVVTPEQRQRTAQVYSQLATTASAHHALEITFKHRDGHHVRGEYTLGRAAIADGSVLVLVGVTPHGTQLSLLEADRFALVGALAAGFAHEINNPLTSVLLNLRSLRKQLIAALPAVAQPAALRCVDDITIGAERIASNVRALQTLATHGTSETLDLAAVVSSALRLAAPSLEPRANVVRNISPVAAVIGEESRVGQAVLAMLLFSSSGFDADPTASSPRISVTVEERDGGIVVEVSDNGHDLSAEEIQHAFEPFFRSRARGAGVGVGLSVARSVAATLGGEVVLAPRPGGGAVITMRLPAAAPPT
jgi:PAS domain S-box-containing protein